VYGVIPLAFAIHDPRANALAATLLLASYLANGSAFLAFSIMAERRRLTIMRHGLKSLYYLAGLAEGFETIVFMAAFCLWPEWFSASGDRIRAIVFHLRDGSSDSWVENVEMNGVRAGRAGHSQRRFVQPR
jgi:hypothetical protein